MYGAAVSFWMITPGIVHKFFWRLKKLESNPTTILIVRVVVGHERVTQDDLRTLILQLYAACASKVKSC